MKFVSFLIIALFCISSPVLAQRDLPVCGHAATLVDLLKKDYDAIDPDSRPEEISRDMTLVLSIFKSYLSDEQKRGLNADILPVQIKERDTLFKKWSLLKRRVTSFNTIATGSIKSSLDAENVAANLQKQIKLQDDEKAKYFEAKSHIDDHELRAIQRAYDGLNNKLLSYMIGKIREKYDLVQAGQFDTFATTNPSSEIQKGLPFIGGDLSFATAMDGLAKFLAKRVKEEMTLYVMERVKKWLKDPSQDDPLAELKAVLPQTTKFLVGFNVQNFNDFPNELRQVINDDLDHLLDNAQDLRNTPRIRGLLNTHPDLEFAFDALAIVPDISKIKTTQDYFSVLERSRGLSRWKNSADSIKRNIANAIMFTGMLAHSMAIIDNGEQKLATVSFLTSYGEEKNFFLLYTGFLRQQNQKYYDISFDFGRIFKLDEALSVIVKQDPEKIAAFDEVKELVDQTLNSAAKNAEKIY